MLLTGWPSKSAWLSHCLPSWSRWDNHKRDWYTNRRDSCLRLLDLTARAQCKTPLPSKVWLQVPGNKVMATPFWLLLGRGRSYSLKKSLYEEEHWFRWAGLGIQVWGGVLNRGTCQNPQSAEPLQLASQCMIPWHLRIINLGRFLLGITNLVRDASCHLSVIVGGYLPGQLQKLDAFV